MNKSAQGLYHIIPDNDTAFTFVEFLHYKGTAVLHAVGGPGAPLIYVSLLEEARNHIAKIGSTSGVFMPDTLSHAPVKAKHFFP